MQTSNITINSNKEISTERKEYLDYCKTEALNIFNELKFDIAEDMRDKGKPLFTLTYLSTTSSYIVLLV